MKFREARTHQVRQVQIADRVQRRIRRGIPRITIDDRCARDQHGRGRDLLASYEYVLNPRRLSDPAVVSAALSRGCDQVLSLTVPCLTGNGRELFERLASEYLKQ
jgi:hypothetical protein